MSCLHKQPVMLEGRLTGKGQAARQTDSTYPAGSRSECFAGPPRYQESQGAPQGCCWPCSVPLQHMCSCTQQKHFCSYKLGLDSSRPLTSCSVWLQSPQSRVLLSISNCWSSWNPPEVSRNLTGHCAVFLDSLRARHKIARQHIQLSSN